VGFIDGEADVAADGNDDDDDDDDAQAAVIIIADEFGCWIVLDERLTEELADDA
jgi:hypothetical protein